MPGNGKLFTWEVQFGKSDVRRSGTSAGTRSMVEAYPRLRALNVQWTEWEGQPMVSLQDPLRLGGNGILVSQTVAPLLDLCDGTRSLNELRTGFLLRAGVTFSPGQVESLIQPRGHLGATTRC